MQATRRTRRMVAGVVLAVSVLPLAACRGGSSPTPVVAPVVGQCHAYDAAEATKAFETSAPVSCSGEHTAETFAVADDLPAPAAGGTWTTAQQTAAAAVPCSPAAHARWLGISLRRLDATRMSDTFFVPMPAQAEAGSGGCAATRWRTPRKRSTSTSGRQQKLAAPAGAFALRTTNLPQIPFDASICAPGSKQYASATSVTLGTSGSAYPGAAAVTAR